MAEQGMKTAVAATSEPEKVGVGWMCAFPSSLPHGGSVCPLHCLCRLHLSHRPQHPQENTCVQNS